MTDPVELDLFDISPGRNTGGLWPLLPLFSGRFYLTFLSGFGQALIGGLYGALDGAIVGAVLAWLYNTLASRSGS